MRSVLWIRTVAHGRLMMRTVLNAIGVRKAVFAEVSVVRR